MKAWLIALAAIAGLTWMVSGLSHDNHGVVANSSERPDSIESVPKALRPTQVDSGGDVRREAAPMMRGMRMMDGMMSMMGHMMNGGKMSGGMMDGCPMMNGKRPNDQWQSAPSAR